MCTLCQQLDPAKTDALGERLITLLNHSALALLISLGHRSGLFDTLARLKPASSEDIAQAAGLNERYVREWLGGLLTGRLIEHDPRRTPGGCRRSMPRC
jgi:hypothetical protein